MQDRSRQNVEKQSPGPELIRGMRGLRDVLRKGESVPDRFTMRTVELELEPREYCPEDIQALRQRLRASQSIFAQLLGVSIKTVQAWEQGDNPPTPMARRLLEMIENNPKPWEKILRESAIAI